MHKKLFVICSLLCLLFAQEVFVPKHAATAEFIVQPGDILTHIARRFGPSAETIVAANDIADANLIVVGQILDIPEVSAATVLSTPDIEPLLVADFNSCAGTNNLGGQMGVAFQAPHNQVSEVYVPETGRGCKAKLAYQIRDWGAFWMKLPNLDLSQYRQNDGVLTFDIRAEQPIPYGVQIELKRFCVPNEGCGELSVYFMTGITADWQTRTVPLEGFGSIGWAPPLSSWESVEELVFTVAFPTAGNNGTLHLDNIGFTIEPKQISVPPSHTPSPPAALPASQATCVGASSAEFTTQSWLAMRDNNPEKALTCTQRTIELWTAEADAQQAQKEQQGSCYITPDPADQAAVDAYWGNSWAVNDVATSWLIRSNALWQLGEVDAADQAYQTVIDHYSCGWAWDPAGWFWHIAHAAYDQLEQLPD